MADGAAGQRHRAEVGPPPLSQGALVNRLRGRPTARFYSSLDHAESCAIATVGVEVLDMGKLADHLLDKWGIIVTPLKHPDGLVEGIRCVVNVSLTVREGDIFGDVMENILWKGTPV